MPFSKGSYQKILQGYKKKYNHSFPIRQPHTRTIKFFRIRPRYFYEAMEFHRLNLPSKLCQRRTAPEQQNTHRIWSEYHKKSEPNIASYRQKHKTIAILRLPETTPGPSSALASRARAPEDP